MEYYFEPDDKLNRIKYARFLESLIQSSQLINHTDNGGSFAVALNAARGTGKTRFSIMLKNLLLNRLKKPNSENQDDVNEPASKFNVVYYNAWESDFWGDALDPLLEKIITAETFQLDEDDKDFDELKKVAAALIKGTGYAFLKHIFGDAAVSIIKEGVAVAFNPPSNPLKGFQEKEKQISDFKKSLSSAVIKTDEKMKLIIIIDELDRCRPTFAIQTLEYAKHLFDIVNVVLIVALDIEQLSYAAKAVYGAMDTAGYICRFFDYIGNLPAPDILSFIKIRLNSLQFYNRIRKMNIGAEQFESMITSFIVSLAKIFNLSLRDLDAILSAYEIMTRMFLSTYLDVQAHMIYLFLLSFKNKNICLYSQLFSERNKSTDFFIEIARTYDIADLKYIEFWLKSISTTSTIDSISLLVYIGEDVVSKRYVRIVGLKEDTNIKTKIQYAYLDEENASGKKHYIDNRKTNLGRVLFFEDLLKWDEIRSLTLYEYYYQQLEMFKFALPADEPKPQS